MVFRSEDYGPGRISIIAKMIEERSDYGALDLVEAIFINGKRGKYIPHHRYVVGVVAREGLCRRVASAGEGAGKCGHSVLENLQLSGTGSIRAYADAQSSGTVGRSTVSECLRSLGCAALNSECGVRLTGRVHLRAAVLPVPMDDEVETLFEI
jgi:hypothetical protein